MTQRLSTHEARATATEAQIQRAITDYLRAQRIPHSVTDATESFNRNGQRVRRVTSGWPDITGCVWDGVMLCCEVKSAKGRLRPEQARMLHDLYMAGALVCIARSVDDLIETLQAGKMRQQDLLEICRYKDKQK